MPNESNDPSSLGEERDLPPFEIISSRETAPPFETYQDNLSVTSITTATTPLLYTSFEGPDGTNDNDKCGGDDEENCFSGRKSTAQSEKKLWIAICISLFFFCVELVGGWLAGSLALLSDSFHLLSGHHHGHGEHDGDHGHGENVNVRAALLHVLGDLLSSIGVLISSVIIMCDPNMAWVDPLCTFIFSAFVMATTFGILRSGIRVLMEATPSHIDSHAVEMDLREIEGVESVHDLHIWDLTIGRTRLTAHLRLHEYNPDIRAEPYVAAKILSQAREMLKNKYRISYVTIQIES
ncbi:11891_t:CDS:2 [Acaulospora colombiana]|uniref:11891_t:CDS:1 n=1 Tax=Acaulospora colombiana TaxID=27376 RepID=A0ACA9M4W1_9GLOM|nr:11891_t:CDS:2 [Acaulospora colombiana]